MLPFYLTGAEGFEVSRDIDAACELQNSGETGGQGSRQSYCHADCVNQCRSSHGLKHDWE